MAEYEQYHGIVIRALVAELKDGMHIKTHDAHGILNSFLINHSIGLYIKHSSKRMSPWLFSFTADNLVELQLLEESTDLAFVSLVCGHDGFLTLSMEELEYLSDKKQPNNSLTIHVKRRKRHMYAVGGRDKLESNKARGFTEEMIQALAK